MTYANQTHITGSYTKLRMDLRIDTSRKLVANSNNTNPHWTANQCLFPSVIHYLDNCECETDNLNCYFTSCILSLYHTIPSFHESEKSFENNAGKVTSIFSFFILFSALLEYASSNEPHETSVWSETASYVVECFFFFFMTALKSKKLTIASCAFIIQFNP